jgi:hypothetical protein
MMTTFLNDLKTVSVFNAFSIPVQIQNQIQNLRISMTTDPPRPVTDTAVSFSLIQILITGPHKQNLSVKMTIRTWTTSYVSLQDAVHPVLK